MCYTLHERTFSKIHNRGTLRNVHCAYKQRWEVTKYKYFVTVLKKIFLVSVLYFTIYFSDYFLLLLPTFLQKYLYFLLLTFSNQARYFSFGGSPFDNKSIIHHESVSLDWQRDSSRTRSASPPKGFYQSNPCKRLENGVDQRGKTTDLFMTSSAGQFHL